MKRSTEFLVLAWLLFISGMIAALALPVGSPLAVWVLLPTCLIGLPLIVHFAVVMLGPMRESAGPSGPRVVVDGVEYVPRTTLEADSLEK